MEDKKIKDKSIKAKAPNKMLESTFNGKVSKSFCDIRDIVLSLINDPNDDPDNLDYDVYLEEYKSKFALKFDNNIYRKIRNDVKEQMSKHTLMSGVTERGNPVDYFPIEEVEWVEEEDEEGNRYFTGTIHIVLGRRFKKIVSDKKNGMTYYSIAYTLPMKSKYSKVMFPRLFEHLRQPKLEFKARGSLRGQFFNYFEPIEQFRAIVGIPDTYVISNIKKTCQNIIDEIAEYTDYEAEVFYNLGRSPESKRPITTHIAWNIKPKEVDIVDAADFQEIRNKKDPAQRDVFGSNLYDVIQLITGLDSRSAQSIEAVAVSVGMERDQVLDNCRYAMRQPNVQDLGAYINSLIKRGGYADPVASNPQPEHKQRKKRDPAKTKFNDFKQHEYSDAQMKDFEKRLFNK